MFLTAWFVLYVLLNMLILGSGILPVPMWILIISVSPLAVGWSLAWPRIRGRWRPLTLIAMALVTFYLLGQVYMYFVDKGFGYAKAHGVKLAYAIYDYHKEQDRWPENLTELPRANRPALDPHDISPYIYIRGDDGRFEKVGGFFISYKLSEGKPTLTVGRRDFRDSWDWDKMAWKKCF